MALTETPLKRYTTRMNDDLNGVDDVACIVIVVTITPSQTNALG